MATVDKHIADRIIAGEWDDETEADERAVKIIEYDNAFNGVNYGVVFPYDDPNMYRETDFVRKPRLYWERPKASA